MLDFEAMKTRLAREINSPRSEWSPAELFARLAQIEEMESHARFLVSLDDPKWVSVLHRLES